MTEIARATPIAAKAIWLKHEQQHGRATLRGVAEALAQAGMKVSYRTIDRWKKRGWAEASKVKNIRPSATALAKERLDQAAPVLTGNPMSTAAEATQNPNLPAPLDPLVISLAETENFRRELEGTSDGVLMRLTSRQLYIASALLLHRIQQNPQLSEEQPEPMAKLVKALGDAITAAHNGMLVVLNFQERVMKVIPGAGVADPEQDPQKLAFDAFDKARDAHRADQAA